MPPRGSSPRRRRARGASGFRAQRRPRRAGSEQRARRLTRLACTSEATSQAARKAAPSTATAPFRSSPAPAATAMPAGSSTAPASRPALRRDPLPAAPVITHTTRSPRRRKPGRIELGSGARGDRPAPGIEHGAGGADACTADVGGGAAFRPDDEEPDPITVIAASSWTPGAAEMGVPPGSRRRPAALTRAPYTSGPVDGERSSCPRPRSSSRRTQPPAPAGPPRPSRSGCRPGRARRPPRRPVLRRCPCSPPDAAPPRPRGQVVPSNATAGAYRCWPAAGTATRRRAVARAVRARMGASSYSGPRFLSKRDSLQWRLSLGHSPSGTRGERLG